MPKKPPAKHADPPESREIPAPPDSAPRADVTSSAALHLNDRMALAAKPNDGQPLSHRNRGKAGRKG